MGRKIKLKNLNYSSIYLPLPPPYKGGDVRRKTSKFYPLLTRKGNKG